MSSGHKKSLFSDLMGKIVKAHGTFQGVLKTDKLVSNFLVINASPPFKVKEMKFYHFQGMIIPQSLGNYHQQ